MERMTREVVDLEGQTCLCTGAHEDEGLSPASDGIWTTLKRCCESEESQTATTVVLLSANVRNSSDLP
jgi:hypothetical protein